MVFCNLCALLLIPAAEPAVDKDTNQAAMPTWLASDLSLNGFFSFLNFSSYLHSGRSKVTRAAVGRDTDQPKFWSFVNLILRP